MKTNPEPLSTPGAPLVDTPPMGRNGHKRNGKIAQLPKALRDQINQWLDDGHTYPQIIKDLGDHGTGLDPGHVSQWYKGGYQDYLRKADHRDDLQSVRQWAAELPELSDGPQFRKATMQLGLTEIFRALTDSKTRTDPAYRIRLLNTLARLNHETLLEATGLTDHGAST